VCVDVGVGTGVRCVGVGVGVRRCGCSVGERKGEGLGISSESRCW